MTLLFLVNLICFTTPPFVGITAGKEAGVVGIMIGMGVGLVAGGLASYAVKKTEKYSNELNRKSQSQVVEALISLGAVVWIVSLLFAAVLVTSFSTKFIVQQLA